MNAAKLRTLLEDAAISLAKGAPREYKEDA
jgi:hypothetical protein